MTEAKKTFALISDNSWEAFLDWFLPQYTRKDKLTVTVSKYRKTRSTDMNRFYFGCVVGPIAEFTGYTIDETHEEILGAYYGWEKKEFRGHVREYPRRRSTQPEVADTLDFMGLIQTGQAIAANLNIVLPDMEK